ncbi:MAG: sulfotransferase domain-containing protein [Candidatus Nitrospinota bacterium M3_3B_026]
METEIDGKPVRLPDFLIVGAPKCGTTAMARYLGQHPGIYMPRRKEAHFFATDLLRPDDRFRSLDNYAKLFQSPAARGKLIGEASVFYLYSKDAPRNIHRLNRDARIIIMLRNPVDMLPSYHSQLVFNGDEDILGFGEALEAEEGRKAGAIPIPENVRFRERFFYTEVASFSGQVERYLETFGEDRVHVIIYDDFKSNTAAVYRKTLEFLGAGPEHRPEFKVVNPNKRPRLRALSIFLRHPPPLARVMANKTLPRAFRAWITDMLGKINAKHVPRPEMDPELRRMLKARFADDVKRLSRILGRDLTHWTENGVEGA